MISICENKSIIDSGSRVALSRNSIAFYLAEKELTGKSFQYSLHQIRCHRWIRVCEVVHISQLWWIPRSPKAKWEFKRRWGIFFSIFTTLYLPVFLLILFQTKPSENELDLLRFEMFSSKYPSINSWNFSIQEIIVLSATGRVGYFPYI